MLALEELEKLQDEQDLALGAIDPVTGKRVGGAASAMEALMQQMEQLRLLIDEKDEELAYMRLVTRCDNGSCFSLLLSPHRFLLSTHSPHSPAPLRCATR